MIAIVNSVATPADPDAGRSTRRSTGFRLPATIPPHERTTPMSGNFKAANTFRRSRGWTAAASLLVALAACR